MKKLHILLAGFLLLFVYACEDKLELSPHDQVSANYDTMEEFELLLNGVYSSFTAGAYYGELKIAMEAWAADDLKISPQNNGQGAFVHNWSYASDDQNAEAIWSRFYTTVYRANLIINNAPGFDPPTEADRQRLNEIRAQALSLRALVHFHAHKLFAEPSQGGSELSVPYVTQISLIQQPARMTTNEVFAAIRADISEAMSLADIPFGTFVFDRASKHSLLAQVALYEANYSEVITQVNNALDAGAPPLATGATYAGMWNQLDVAGENIFKINFTPGSAAVGNIFYINSLDASYFWATEDLLDLYDQSNDIRFDAFFDVTRWPRVTKYIGDPSIPGLADAKVFRTSDLYLMRAEAHYQTGDQSSALADLDAIRTARIAGFVSPGETGEALFQAIQTERRKELVYESSRFFYFLRWDQSNNRGDCAANRCELEAGDHRFVFPIPEAEVFANDNMVQNPGY